MQNKAVIAKGGVRCQERKKVKRKQQRDGETSSIESHSIVLHTDQRKEEANGGRESQKMEGDKKTRRGKKR